jgi:hypothetical protein
MAHLVGSSAGAFRDARPGSFEAIVEMFKREDPSEADRRSLGGGMHL